MATLLNFGGAYTYNLENTKTIAVKRNLLNDITSQYKCECNEIC